MLKRLSLISVLAAILVIAGCTPRPAETPEESILKIGSLPRILDLPAYVAQQEDLYQKHGITVEIIPFRSTTEMSTTFLSGELDGIIQGTFGSVNLNKEQKTSKFVASCFMPHMFEIVASADSGITKPEQLKDRQIATAISTVMDYSLDRLLASQGVEPEDIVKVNIPIMPLRLETLVQGKVDGAILTSPLSDFAVFNGGRIIIDDTDKPFGGPGLIFSLKALEDKPDTIGRFIQAWQQAVDLINPNPEKYHNLLAEVARVPEEITEKVKVPTFPKLHLPDETEIASVIDWMMTNGLLNTPPAYSDIVETRYLR